MDRNLIKINQRKWGNNTNFVYYIDTVQFKKEACFSRLTSYLDSNEIKTISINIPTLNLEKSINYVNKIIKIFNMDVIEFDKENLFLTFKNTKVINSFIILTCIRFSYELFADKQTFNSKINEFIDNVITKVNTLEEFCKEYKKIKINENYMHSGHCWEPSKTKIKSLKDFNKYKGTSVNTFFTT
jgi:hypothetical protein